MGQEDLSRGALKSKRRVTGTSNCYMAAAMAQCRSEFMSEHAFSKTKDGYDFRIKTNVCS
ncbi:hypothetical protein GCM10027040_04060 [Halomonas shantousis]